MTHEGDAKDITRAIALLAGKIDRPVKLMEVCGTHTVAIFRHGIRDVLPDSVSLLSGPGCPVCVTPVRDVEAALAYAGEPDVVLATFGDMMRVPGGGAAPRSLYDARAEGADVRVYYSPLDALRTAAEHPERKVVFFATGFETTSPLVAATLMRAGELGVENFFIYPAHKLVPPALRALLEAGEAEVDGFMLPGHVSAIIGARPYAFLTEEFETPSVVTGFGAGDILEGILMLLEQIASEMPRVGIQYRSVVREEGNQRALEALRKCFEPSDDQWRGIGTIPASGLALRGEFVKYDIRESTPLTLNESPEPRGCSCGEVLTGVIIPPECALFGRGCTPERPVGACMVSTEGSCAAYYRYGGGTSSGR
jgi:hydrogenase expression/formation protein HypD